MLLRSQSVMTIINCGSPLFFVGKSIIKSIESLLWNLSGIGEGAEQPFVPLPLEVGSPIDIAVLIEPVYHCRHSRPVETPPQDSKGAILSGVSCYM